MVKMITLCHRFDTVRRPSSLFALAMLATVTALGSLESVGQEAALETKKSYSVLLNPPLSTTDSDPETEIEQQQEVPQTSPEPEVLMRGPLHEAFAEASGCGAKLTQFLFKKKQIFMTFCGDWLGLET